MQKLYFFSNNWILKLMLLGFYSISFNILYCQSSFDIFPIVPNSDNQAQAWSLYCADEGFFVLGDLLDTTEKIIPWLGYFDYNGQAQNSFTIIDSTVSNSFRIGAYKFYKNATNNFLLYGSQVNDNGVIRPKIVEVDPNDGNIIRSAFVINPIDSTMNLSRKSMIYKDSIIILTNYYWVSNHYNLYIVIIDHDFQIIDDFIISDQNYNNVVYQVICENDTTITLIGESSLAADQSDLPDIKPFIYRTSLQGDSIYFKIFDDFNERTIAFGVSYAHTVQRDSANNWVISCLKIVENTNCFNCYKHIPYTFSLDSNFVNLNWLHEFVNLSPNVYSQPQVTSMVKCSDGSGFITAGFDTYSFIYKVNNNGDTMWLRKYIPISWDDDRALWTEFVDLEETANGNLLMCGRVSDNELGIIRPWIVQLDKYGCFAPGCHLTNTIYSMDEVTKKYFTVYPNPSSQELLILSNNSGETSFILKIISNDGTILKSKQIYISHGTYYLLPIEDLTPGSYYISIVSKDKTIFETHTFIKQ